MIRLGLRLCVASGREAFARLVLTGLAMALGVAMLLVTFAGINAASAQNHRAAWLATSPGSAAAARRTGVDGLWWLVTAQPYGSQLVVTADVAGTGPRSPVPPGIPRLPRPGQFYASPALSRLIRSTPPTALRDRFGTTQLGTISVGALSSPSDLVAVVGTEEGVLRRAARCPNCSVLTSAGEIYGFQRSAPDGGPLSLSVAGMDALFAIAALALLFPLLVFISTTTRLSAARRERRLATLRLLGATTRQVAFIAAVEATLAALIAVGVGFALFFVVRPVLYHVAFTGRTFEPGDLVLNGVDVLVAVLGIPLAAAIVARAALRRIAISPLGVSRRVTPRRPGAWRIVPLLAGIGELSYFVANGHPTSTGAQINAYFLGFLLTMLGLVLSGPLFVLVGGRLIARSRRPSLLIAGRRLSDDPKGSFRSISGLILALFVTSATVGILSTLLANAGGGGPGTAASRTVIDQFSLNPGAVPPVSPATLASLRAVPGVTGVAIAYSAPRGTRTDGAVPKLNDIGGSIVPEVVSCAQLSGTPALGRCAKGATYASVGPVLGNISSQYSVAEAAATVWPKAVFGGGLARAPVQMIAVATDGSPGAIGRAETILALAYPYSGSIGSFGGLPPQTSQLLDEVRAAGEVVICGSLLIAGCSLAVATVAALADRRRPFSVLRLSGVSVALLRRVIGAESGLPLVVIALGATGIGLLTAELFLRSQLQTTLAFPGGGFLAIVGGGLVAALAIIGTTLPLLQRSTRPESARFE